MQQVARIPEDLHQSKDPLKELTLRMGIDEPQEVVFHIEPGHGRCCLPDIKQFVHYTKCRCELCKEKR